MSYICIFLMVWKTYYCYDFNKINYESLNITKLNFKRFCMLLQMKFWMLQKFVRMLQNNNNNNTSQRIFNDIINK